MQLPDYYGSEEPQRMSYRVTEQLRKRAWDQFSAMDVFFVKVRSSRPTTMAFAAG
jgi:hypothetical protein